MRIFAFAPVCLLAAAAGVAHASTTIVGGTVINQTWDAAGSPYLVQGDVTVPNGAFLTIQPGTVIQAASSDGQGANTDKTKVEIIIKGTLTVNGTAPSPVLFQGAVASSGTWYGIEIDATATSVSIDYATVRDANQAITNAAPGAVFTASNVTVTNNSNYGLFLSDGTGALDAITSTSNPTGIYFAGTAAPTLTNCIVRNNTSFGVYDGVGSNVTPSLVGCTLNANGTYNIYASAATSSMTVRDTIITNASYGIYRSSGAQINVSYTDVWNNTTNYLGSGIAASIGMLSSNPLYVGATDLHLTSNSPARFGAMAGGDMGALPYAGAATPGLYGVLWVDTTLGTAGSPYTVGGDLTVPAGVTLTIQPGVTLDWGNGDVMGSNTDQAHGELIVNGTLVADGTTAQKITFDATTPSSGSWYGIEVNAGATGLVLDNVAVGHANQGITYAATAASGNSITHATISNCSNYGLFFSAGAPTTDAITVTSNPTGVYFAGTAAPKLTNCVVRNNTSFGVYDGVGSNVTPSLVNCTLNANGTYNIYASAATSSMTIVNTIITNASYGIYRSSGATINVSYSDVWNNTTNYLGSGIVTTTGMISQNPLYVGATDLHLQGTSVCIDAGTGTGAPTTDADGVTRPLDGDGINGAAWDLGAYELAVNAVCGDGAVEPGEVCDDGANNGKYGYCNASCTAMGPRCGDGMKNGPEECDDGNASNTDACLTTCKAAACGDGYVEAGVEQCDDGNTDNTDGCVGACQLAKCGDGYVRAGVEMCDDGNTSNTDACLNTCVPARCGDGVVEAGVEDCDDGNSINTDACLNTCVAASCGDGFLHAGVETCDDGNHINTDACTNACEVAVCGDGIVHAGVEQCDDGNTDNTDACVTGCQAAKCGDGYVEVGIEACDDGNQVDTDGCRNDCALPTCGDGVVQAGEQCDDGNQVDTDACRDNCLSARCGDGVVETGVEQCDDGNTTAGDGCSATCTIEGTPDAMPGTPDAMPSDAMMGPGQDAAGPTSQPGGCCDTGGRGDSSIALGVMVLLIARRRRTR